MWTKDKRTNILRLFFSFAAALLWKNVWESEQQFHKLFLYIDTFYFTFLFNFNTFNKIQTICVRLFFLIKNYCLMFKQNLYQSKWINIQCYLQGPELKLAQKLCVSEPDSSSSSNYKLCVCVGGRFSNCIRHVCHKIKYLTCSISISPFTVHGDVGWHLCNKYNCIMSKQGHPIISKNRIPTPSHLHNLLSCFELTGLTLTLWFWPISLFWFWQE